MTIPKEIIMFCSDLVQLNEKTIGKMINCYFVAANST